MEQTRRAKPEAAQAEASKHKVDVPKLKKDLDDLLAEIDLVLETEQHD